MEHKSLKNLLDELVNKKYTKDDIQKLNKSLEYKEQELSNIKKIYIDIKKLYINLKKNEK